MLPDPPIMVPDPNAPPMMNRNAYSFLVSREMALDFGLVEATPEEAAEREASAAAFRARCADEWPVYLHALRALDGLDAENYPVARRVLDLHAPVEPGAPSPRCSECCRDGDHPAEWPCATVEAVAGTFGIPLPNHYLLAGR